MSGERQSRIETPRATLATARKGRPVLFLPKRLSVSTDAFSCIEDIAIRERDSWQRNDAGPRPRASFNRHTICGKALASVRNNGTASSGAITESVSSSSARSSPHTSKSFFISATAPARVVGTVCHMSSMASHHAAVGGAGQATRTRDKERRAGRTFVPARSH